MPIKQNQAEPLHLSLYICVSLSSVNAYQQNQAEDTEIRDHAEEQSVELDFRNVFS